jgi:hypothetical protein
LKVRAVAVYFAMAHDPCSDTVFSRKLTTSLFYMLYFLG